MHFKSVLSVGLALVCPAIASGIERSDLIPEDAEVKIHLNSVDVLSKRFKESPIGQLAQDPQMKTAMDVESWEKTFLQGDTNKANELILQELKMLEGEIAAGGHFLSATNFYGVAELSKSKFKKTLEMDKKIKRLREGESTRKKKEIQGVTVYHDIYPNTPDMWQTHLKNSLLVTSSRDWLEKAIVELRKDGVTGRKAPEKGTIRVEVPLKQLMKEAVARAEKAQKQRQRTQGQGQQLDLKGAFREAGLWGVQQARGRFQVSSSATQFDVWLDGDLNQGLFRSFKTGAFKLPELSYVPENPYFFSRSQFSLLTLWQTIPKVLQAANPLWGQQLKLIQMQVRQNVNLDLEKDVLAHIGNEWLSLGAEEWDAVERIAAVRLRDGAALQKTIESLRNKEQVQGMVSQLLEVKDFMGTPLYEISGPSGMQTRGQAGSTNTMGQGGAVALAIHDGYLFVGLSKIVRDVLRGRKRTEVSGDYRSQEMFRRLKDFAPSENVVGYGATDLSRLVEGIVEKMKQQSSQFPNQSSMGMQGGTPGMQMQSGISSMMQSFQDLPRGEYVGKFFDIYMGYTEKNDKGMHSKMRMLHP